MRDGARLFTTLYIPRDTSEQHPILMTRTPYSCAPYGAEKWHNYYTERSCAVASGKASKNRSPLLPAR